MLKALSVFFSALLHPLLMPLAGLLIIFSTGQTLAYLPREIALSILTTVILSTIAIPLLLIPFLKYFNLINNIYMDEKRERTTPLMIITLLYFFTYYWFKHFSFSPAMQSFILGITVSAMLLFAVSLFWKISMHMVGIGGITGLVALMVFQVDKNYLLWLLIALLASGILGSSRLYLQKHSQWQVYAGYFLGLATILFTTRL
jgi:hypothetical protein